MRTCSVPLLVLLAATITTSCGDRCGGENLNTISSPQQIESFEIRDSKGQMLWKISTTAPASVKFLRYGEVPPGFQQVVPPGSARPRPFVKGETLHETTLTRDSFFNHEGVATGERSFCGGYYENGPRKNYKPAATPVSARL